jgi:hypothetical protein
MSSRASGFSTEERSPGSFPKALARTARRTIFALRVFGRAETKTTRSGLNARPQLRRGLLRDLGCELVRALLSAREDAEDPGDLALHLVGDADGGGLGDGRVGDHG